MKSEHRHELETNVLAHRLEKYIERFRPYLSQLAFGILALIAIIFLWSYISGQSAARRSGAWDVFNLAITSVPPNLDQLRQAAEENPGTNMQKLADLTWADGQLYRASQAFITNRAQANDMLNKAASAYQNVLQYSNNSEVVGRAHLGMARIYEMQDELKKAEAEYKMVQGPYAKYAQAQAERLAKPEAAEASAWLAKAQAPISRPPVGPGEQGKELPFSAGDLKLPGANATVPAPAEPGKSASETFDELLQKMQAESKAKESATETKKEETKTEEAPPAGLENKGASEDKAAEKDKK
jgi:hypothetical protein